MHTASRLASALTALAAAALVHAQSGPDELWDMTTQMQMAGMPAQTMSQPVCMKKGETRAESFSQDKNCKVTEQRQVGNKLSWKVVCSGPDAMTGTGEVTRSGNSMSGRVRMQGKSGGEPVDMTMVYSGKRAGGCTWEDPRKKAQAMVAQGEAQVAQVCDEAMGKYSTMMFEMQGSPCGSRKAEYCARVKKISQTMRTPAGYRAAKKIEGLSGQGWEDAARYCSVQTAPIVGEACKGAVAGRDWNFVVEHCPAESERIAMEHCAGRTYTVAMSSEYKEVCGKHADKFAQPERAAAKPAAATADPVKEGVKEGARALQRLFGR